jgi:phosphinothricin acetyltransferase
MIRDATPSDAGSITEIYSHYVLNSSVTFEIETVSISDMAGRISETQALNLPYLVYVNDEDRVTGYAYASKWKGRCAYKYSVEVSVYLHPDKTGKGAGSQLYAELLKQLKLSGYHAAIGGIALPNPASIALHEKFGMTKVAHFKEIGFKFGRWVDVGYWQGLLRDPAETD